VTQDSSFGQKRRLLFWWIFSLSLLLFALNVAFFFLIAFSTAWNVRPNLRELSNEDPYLGPQFLLVVSFIFLLAGMVAGSRTGKMSVVIRGTLIACFLGSVAMVPVAIFMVVSGIGAKEAGWTFIFLAAGAPFLILPEGIAGVIGGAVGGLIGSHFLRRAKQTP
jgi:ABC-type Co2+ transport system permease subunit